jgi:hypothetical protein
MKTSSNPWLCRVFFGALMLLLLPGLSRAQEIRYVPSRPLRQVQATDPVPDPPPPPSVPLPDDFRARIQDSKLTLEFQAAGFRTRGWKPSYDQGREYFPTDGPPEAKGSRAAIVPLVDKNGFGVGTYNFTFNPTTNIEGASVAVLIPGTPNNTVRDYVDPAFTIFVDVEVNSKGTIVDGGGVCPIAVASVTAGDSSQRLLTAAGSSCGYWDCVLAAVLELALAGHESGLNEACVTACTAGGVANPVCLACLAGAVIALGGIWWHCY